MKVRTLLSNGQRAVRRVFPYKLVRSAAIVATFIGVANCDDCDGGATAPKTDPTLSVTAGPSTQRIAQGSSSTYTITINRDGFSGPVTLGPTANGFPAGISVVFNPTVVPEGVTTSTAVMTIDPDVRVSYDSQTGLPVARSIGFGAVGASGVVAQGLFDVTVTPSSQAGITMNISPGSLVMNVGDTKDATITIARQGKYDGKVSFTVTGSIPNVTATITALPTADTYQLRFVSTTATPSQTQPVFYTVKATPEGLPPISSDVGVFISRPTIAPTAAHGVSMVAGQQDTVTVLLLRSTGFNAPVALSIDSGAAGITGTFAPNPAVDATSLLTVRAASTLPVGSYKIRIHAVPQAGSGADEQFARVTVIVPVVGTYTLSAPDLNVLAGGSITGTFTVNRFGGFVDAVPVTFTMRNGDPLPTGLAVTLAQNPVTGTSTTITATAAATLAPGAYLLTATSGVFNPFSPTVTGLTVTVAIAPRVNSISISKLVNGASQTTNGETIAIGSNVTLVPTVLDQFSNPIVNAPVTWGSANTSVATVSATGVVTAVAAGATTVTVNTNANPNVKASITITVPAAPTSNVARIELEPQNAEITAPASMQYSVTLFDASGAKVAIESGGTLEFLTGNAAVASINASTGVATGISAGLSRITARYLKNGALVRQDASLLTVYAPGSVGHYGSALVSTGGNARTVKAGATLLFQLIVKDVAGNQVTSGLTPAPTVTSDNAAIVVARDGSPGGYFYTMTAAAGAVSGTIVHIRYDVMGAGGEIIMTIVP